MRCKILLFIITNIIILSGCKERVNFPALKGPYLGQKPPGIIPEIFVPGVVSTEFSELFTYFTPDAREVYFQLWKIPFPVIVYMKEEKGKWTKPEIAFFSGMYDEYDILFSPDGNKLYYTLKRPLISEGNPEKAESIWIVTKKENGWSEPENLGAPITLSQKITIMNSPAATGDNLKSGSVRGIDVSLTWLSKKLNTK